jgi:hypothetical protein
MGVQVGIVVQLADTGPIAAPYRPDRSGWSIPFGPAAPGFTAPRRHRTRMRVIVPGVPEILRQVFARL